MDDVHRLVHAVRHRTGGVELMEEVLQLRHDLNAIRQHLVPYFITAGPHHHRCIVAVLLHHIRDIFLPPVVEFFVVIILRFAVVPYVKRLDHHHQAHLVTEFYEFRCGHVMTRADGIASHRLEHRELVTQRIFMHRRAERT